ncbi:ABC transporter ATP-binding protein/permease [Parafrankia sp. FMc2]|uniref:ABC transporter ATP-binding protein/permease n=1 Tax=Parafrankia sp. FMc2 TaxID=3233196 RepID=UPI0034D76EFB
MAGILRYARGAGALTAATTAIRLAVGATYIAQAFLLADVLVAILRGDGVAEQAGRFGWILGLVVARAALLFAAEETRARTAGATKIAIRERGFAKVAELGPVHLAGDRAGDVTATLVDSVEALEGYFSRYIPALVAGIGTPLIAVVALAVTDGWLGLVVLAFAIAAVTGPQLWLGVIGDRSDERMTATIALGSAVLDTMQGMATLKVFGASRRRRDELDVLGQRLIATWVREMAVALIAGAIFTASIVGGMAAVAWAAGSRLADGGLAVHAAFLALVLSAEALRPIAVLAESFHTTYDAGGAARRLDALFALEAPAPDLRPGTTPTAPDGTTPPGPSPAPKAAPTVAFENVTFTYPGARTPSLRNVSLRIEPGERVAIVGASGAGKSTLASLLVRFADPDRPRAEPQAAAPQTPVPQTPEPRTAEPRTAEPRAPETAGPRASTPGTAGPAQAGRVCIGDVDIRTLPVDQVRSQVAMVSQRTHLFNGTVRENLLLTRPDASEADLGRATAAAGADAFVSELPAGFDTVIGEAGGRLSGGQRQRLAIARALLADAPVLILDEATASVDAATEAAIHTTLEALAAGRTTLVIAHRLSTVRDVDRIIVMADGRIVEEGDHTALLAARGAYHRLVTAQEAAA